MRRKKLSDPEAVVAAIAEYDEIGRGEFLRKHVFGRSRRYWILWQGKYYDAHAILAVAYGVQFPTLGPLKKTDFSGRGTIAGTLEDLGFEVVTSSQYPDDVTNQIQRARDEKCAEPVEAFLSAYQRVDPVPHSLTELRLLVKEMLRTRNEERFKWTGKRGRASVPKKGTTWNSAAALRKYYLRETDEAERLTLARTSRMLAKRYGRRSDGSRVKPS